MTLNPTPSYPNSRTYVLKLHRDAGASLSQLSGRLEHLATGRHFEFPTAAALLSHLMSELVAAGAGGDPVAELMRSRDDH